MQTPHGAVIAASQAQANVVQGSRQRHQDSSSLQADAAAQLDSRVPEADYSTTKLTLVVLLTK
jgi:hypothetical protein